MKNLIKGDFKRIFGQFSDSLIEGGLSSIFEQFSRCKFLIYNGAKKFSY